MHAAGKFRGRAGGGATVARLTQAAGAGIVRIRREHEGERMFEDRYGNGLSTDSAAARDAYVEGIDRYLAAEAGVEAALARAVEADPDFALAHLAIARARQSRGDAAGVAAPLAEARAAAGRRPPTPREAGQLEILGLILEGRGRDAYPLVRPHLADHPRDAMVAQTCMGVFGLIGFSGEPGREAEQLAFTTSLAPHYGNDWWFLAQHAFAQMESGRCGPAESTILASLEGNPRNANAAHVRAHLHYETGQTEEGLAWLDAWRRGYDRDGALHCHVSWHVALWALQQGDAARMWAVVDADLAPEATSSPPLNVMTDVAAILCRAQLAGVEVAPERWAAISRYAAERFPRPGVAFADVHAALAHAMAGEGEALGRIISDAAGPAGDLVRGFAEAFGALAEGRWAAAAAALTPGLADHARIGGSRAQRDLLEFAMAAALLRLGKAEEARRLLAIRRPVADPSAAVRGL